MHVSRDLNCPPQTTPGRLLVFCLDLPPKIRSQTPPPPLKCDFSRGRGAQCSRTTRSVVDSLKTRSRSRRASSAFGEEEPQPAAWDRARPALAATTTTPSPPARACSVGGRPVLHGAKRVRPRATGFKSCDYGVRSRSRRPGAVSVKKSLGQRRGVERAARWPRRQPRQVRQRARAPWAVGWFSTGRSARGPRARNSKLSATTFRSRSRRPGAVSVKRASANGVGWSAPRVGREDNHAKSASARVLRGRSAGSPRGEARAGRAARDSKALVTTCRSRSRRPGAVSVKKSLGQRRGVERAPRWLRRQPRQVRQRARAPWAFGRFSTGRSARGPRGTGFRSFA